MRIAATVILTLASLSVAGYALIAYTMFPIGSLVHPEMRSAYAVHRAGILVHIFGSALALMLGPWQFIDAVRTRWPSVHRWIGRAYLGLGVLPGGAAGLYMSAYAFGGVVSHAGFALLAVGWLYSGLRGYTAARARRFDCHRAWMIRNFALALAAVTLRMQLGACSAAGIPFESFYPVLAWTSWVPNLLAAEALLHRKRPKPASS